VRVSASDISTQDTSNEIAVEVNKLGLHDMKCAISDTEPLAFWQQHSRRFPMLRKLAVYLSKQCSQSQQLVSFWMAS